MKYAPRKVYIKESGNYVELSYMDFCRRRQAGQSYMDKLLSLDVFTDSEGNVIDFIVDEAVDVAETVVHAVMVDHYSTWKNWESG